MFPERWLQQHRRPWTRVDAAQADVFSNDLLQFQFLSITEKLRRTLRPQCVNTFRRFQIFQFNYIFWRFSFRLTRRKWEKIENWTDSRCRKSRDLIKRFEIGMSIWRLLRSFDWERNGRIVFCAAPSRWDFLISFQCCNMSVSIASSDDNYRENEAKQHLLKSLDADVASAFVAKLIKIAFPSNLHLKALRVSIAAPSSWIGCVCISLDFVSRKMHLIMSTRTLDNEKGFAFALCFVFSFHYTQRWIFAQQFFGFPFTRNVDCELARIIQICQVTQWRRYEARAEQLTLSEFCRSHVIWKNITKEKRWNGRLKSIIKWKHKMVEKS